MKPIEFVYWLQGYAELDGDRPTPEQWESIKRHIALVLTKVENPECVVEPGKTTQENFYDFIKKAREENERNKHLCSQPESNDPKNYCGTKAGVVIIDDTLNKDDDRDEMAEAAEFRNNKTEGLR